MAGVPRNTAQNVFFGPAEGGVQQKRGIRDVKL